MQLDNLSLVRIVVSKNIPYGRVIGCRLKDGGLYWGIYDTPSGCLFYSFKEDREEDPKSIPYNVFEQLLTKKFGEDRISKCFTLKKIWESIERLY